MNTNTIQIKIFNTIAEAPHYGGKVHPISIDHAVIVRNGTQQGRSTVDLVFTDDTGKKYITMITARILSTIVADYILEDKFYSFEENMK